MMPSVLYRRNRFKRRERTAPAPWRRLPTLIDWRRLAHKTLLPALAVAGLAALAWVLNRPLSVVSMDGSFQRVSPVEIEKAAAPFLASGFMSANLDAIQRAVQALPWVDQVRVQRRWPAGVRVTVIEQTAAASWNGSGLVNTRGDLFIAAAAHVPAELPRLSGPPGTEPQVAQLYLRAQPRMIDAGMRIAALRQDDRGAWEMDVANGVTVRLGRNQLDARIDRFIRSAAPIMARHPHEIAYVDMRYANGFAVGWRSAPAPATAPAAAPAPAALKRRDDTQA